MLDYDSVFTFNSKVTQDEAGIWFQVQIELEHTCTSASALYSLTKLNLVSILLSFNLPIVTY